MQVHQSALKHGVDPDDAVHAAEHPEYTAPLDDDSPARELRLGFDRSARLLEIVVLTFDSGNQLIIHAMPARRSYRELL
ncbi:toxin [Ruania albidiflava]|uniref:toxin n=1 Tax=Ruania albidiflava TaxID=366586 RepID=UPI0023F04B16|nr:toxin [Ruania albidiflava]